MKAEIITIGDEILIGQITDTNSKWIAEQLNGIGIDVHQITSVHDDKAHIAEALRESEHHADLVILTGGLGPTKDDITKKTLADYFNTELVLHQEVLTHIEALFKRLHIPPTLFDEHQALLPEKATVLHNKIGTAAGMWFEENGKIVVSLPGVPTEMKGLMIDEVLPRLRKGFKLPVIVHKTLITYGLNESNMARLLEAWEKQLPADIKLAYLPSYERLRLRLSASGTNRTEIEQKIEREIEKLQPLIGKYLHGTEGTASLEKTINKMLTKKGLTLSTAESCTGGAIAAKITSVPGASNFFKGSLVAYAAEVKESVLRVNPNTIKKYTVVSAEVAREMVVNCRRLFKTDFAIATTGNAGPTTDKTDTTVGAVFIAVAAPGGVQVEEFNFGQPREKVITRSVSKALEMVYKKIQTL